MTEFDRMMELVGGSIGARMYMDDEESNFIFDNRLEMREQLFAEYLMEAGMIPERIAIPNEAYAHYLLHRPGFYMRTREVRAVNR